MPVGGVIWQTVQYLIGLQRLGFDVYYMEDHGIYPSMFTDDEDFDGSGKAAAFIAKILGRFDFSSRWSYHAWHGEEHHFGLSPSEMNGVFERATAVINLHGATMPRPEHRLGGPFIYLETDPVKTEVELHEKLQSTEDFLDAHTAHFTYAENLGAPDCKVPLPPARYQFRPTRQPIICDFWENATAPGEYFTTIANWCQPRRPVTLNGEVFHWSKHYEFMKFLDLPQRTAQQFELALSSYEKPDREMLEAKGWRVRDALEFTREADAYRDYIFASRGEWTVAKDQNVRLRSGWFSDRAASYLAAGRPVVTQETGFSEIFPTGEGLFGFSTIEEILGAIDRINADYRLHSRRAAEIAREYFEAGKVLSALLEQAGVSISK